MADKYFHHPQDAVNEFTRQLNEEVALQIKSLLEEKHLYQKVVVNPRKFLDAILARVPGDYQKWVCDVIEDSQPLNCVNGSGRFEGNWRCRCYTDGDPDASQCAPLLYEM